MQRTTLPKTWIFFFIIVVVLLVATFLSSRFVPQSHRLPSQAPGDQATLPATREDHAKAMLQNGQDTILISDQQAGQKTIDVDYAILAEPGFVTIREDDHGMPGNVIGVSSLLKERTDHISVRLSSALQSNQVYYAELVKDDGDGVFVELKDRPVQDRQQSVVLMSFQTSTGS